MFSACAIISVIFIPANGIILRGFMSICEKCNETGTVLPGKFKTWWLSFFYGYDKDYIAYRYQKQCDCKEKDTNKLIFPEEWRSNV
jgi:hypothetical protein